MNITENYSRYSAEELFGLAERENNSKRRSLIVNRIQGKHIPARPSEILSLFGGLAERIPYNGEKTAVIGFAETATAIGAAIAEGIKADIYIHTTREKFPAELRIADFSEEHSHASEQNLFSRDKTVLDGIERIIFAEDELTTGKTILNFINALKGKTSPNCRFSAVSLINGMGKENLDTFGDNNIDLHWLVKIDGSLSALNERLDIVPENDISSGHSENFTVIESGALPDPRLSAAAADYVSAVRKNAEHIFSETESFFRGCRTIDVIGTEEFMYPAVKLGEYFEKGGFSVTTHSTTRSPIVPSCSEGYPLFSRVKLKSFYDRERSTYLYNIYPADGAVVFTDTPDFSEETAAELASVLRSEKIIFVRSRSV